MLIICSMTSDQEKINKCVLPQLTLNFSFCSLLVYSVGGETQTLFMLVKHSATGAFLRPRAQASPSWMLLTVSHWCYIELVPSTSPGWLATKSWDRIKVRCYLVPLTWGTVYNWSAKCSGPGRGSLADGCLGAVWRTKHEGSQGMAAKGVRRLPEWHHGPVLWLRGRRWRVIKP